MNINEPRHGGGFVLPFFNDSKKSRKPGAGRESLQKTVPLRFVTGSLRSGHRWFHSHNRTRNHFVATMAEFIGTTLFLFFAFAGTQVAKLATPSNNTNIVGTPSDPSQLLYIALSFGFSLAVNAWVFFRISGGLFNPAVTVGMCLVGALPYFRGLLLFIAQILGGITAAALVSALFPGPVTSGTALAGGTSITRGLFIEMFLTAELVFTIFMLAAEKHRGTFIAPIGIGLALFIAELTGLYFTGGSVNPARSFGPSVVSHSFPGYHWIYWLGPILGAILASVFYKIIKLLEYETANPGQDGDGVAASVGHTPDHKFNTNTYSSANEGLIGRELDASGASQIHGGNNYGPPKEYGTQSRPFSDSPAPPHPNDQFAGLSKDGGLHDHNEELVKDGVVGEQTRIKRDSEGTLVDNGRRASLRPASNNMGAGAGTGTGPATGAGVGAASGLRGHTYNSQSIGEGEVVHAEVFDK